MRLSSIFKVNPNALEMLSVTAGVGSVLAFFANTDPKKMQD